MTPANSLCAALVALLVTACASTDTAAPVETRTAGGAVAETSDAAPAATPAPTLPRPGYHIVKRGETLYSIALENGQDYREVARWNSLDNPNVIQVGQELRVTPPDTGMSVAPVAVPSIEIKPAAGSASSAPAGTPVAAGVKSEPKGGRVAYSPQALADLQKGGSAGIAAPSVPPVAAAASAASVIKPPVPAAASAPVAATMTSSPAASAPAASSEAKSGDDAIDWLWPSNGKLIATFNDSSSKGVDLAGNVGDPVLATAAGKVIYVGSDLRGYGNLVIIKHNNSYLSAYAHNSEVLVKEGLQVTRGQKIAAVGMSDADRPKLHFEIRRQGKPVDPLKYLPKR